MGLSFAMLKAWGYLSRTVTLGLTVASIWNQFIVFGTPPLALALLTAAGGVNPLLETFSWVGLAIAAALGFGFAASIYSDDLARGFGDLLANLVSRGLRAIRRAPVHWSGQSFVRFRRDARELLRSRWHWITLATLAGHLSMWVVLVAALRAVGVSGGEVSLIESFAAWSLVRVLGAIPIVPGGFGVIELGLTTALVGFGANNAEAVAGVMIYRVLTVAPPLLLGTLAGATWRRHHPGWQTQAAAETPATAAQ
jgi:uncharacterized membrane protein YbhN (UPF0104 family)